VFNSNPNHKSIITVLSRHPRQTIECTHEVILINENDLHTGSKGVKSVRTNENNGPLLFDGGVDIVAAFRFGYYGGGSRCRVQASADSAGDRACQVLVVSVVMGHDTGIQPACPKGVNGSRGKKDDRTHHYARLRIIGVKDRVITVCRPPIYW
jgi:hypothetical protein